MYTYNYITCPALNSSLDRLSNHAMKWLLFLSYKICVCGTNFVVSINSWRPCALSVRARPDQTISILRWWRDTLFSKHTPEPNKCQNIMCYLLIGLTALACNCKQVKTGNYSFLIYLNSKCIFLRSLLSKLRARKRNQNSSSISTLSASKIFLWQVCFALSARRFSEIISI